MGDKCPYCGAKRDRQGDMWDFFECGTVMNKIMELTYGSYQRSDQCYETKLAALKATIAALTAKCAALKELSRRLLLADAVTKREMMVAILYQEEAQTLLDQEKEPGPEPV